MRKHHVSTQQVREIEGNPGNATFTTQPPKPFSENIRSMKKILSVFGTRPEAIKMAPVIKELERHSEIFKSVVCVTAQHREMLDQVLDLFEIQPDHDLNIMEANQDLFDVTSNVLLGMKDVLSKVRPDLVLVHGDTTTTLAASLAAFYSGTPVGHVEAGLRTGDKHAPWPEEINRKVAGCIADLHFAPTETARQNLLREGVDSFAIHVTGNTVIDALFMALEKIKREGMEEEIIAGVVARYPALKWLLPDPESPVFALRQHSELRRGKPVTDHRIILVTGHRRESFGEGFENICKALLYIASIFPDIQIIYPVHLNPNVQEPVNRILGKSENIHLLEPLEYLQFILLMDRCYLVLTDSGGIQEEAPSLGKPVLVTRDTTERPEAVEAGTAKLVGTDMKTIIDAISSLLTDDESYKTMANAVNPYGDGKASERITSVCKQFFNGHSRIT